MNAYPHVFEPITIRGKTYRNRLIAAPTMFAHSIFAVPEMREGVYRMVEARAEGGFACVSTGELPVNDQEGTADFLNCPLDYTRYEGETFEAIRTYASRIQRHGALAYLEFCHEGARAHTHPPYVPWGPESYVRDDGVAVQAMDETMMEKVCSDFYRIARFARACGFDGVLVHGGHGFNMQQFISPLTNHRTDAYGGSMKNRARFPIMLLDAVRAGIGENMVLELRFSAEDGVPGGMTIRDTVEFCRCIDGKADIIHISNGLKWAGNGTHTFTSFLDPHGYNVEFASQVKAAVRRSKVAVVGGFNSPELCEQVLAQGKADFIELGRQCFADPEFPNKANSGRADQIRRCVRCFQCYPGFCEHKTDIPLHERGLAPEQIKKLCSPASMGRCAINPKAGFQARPELMPQPRASRRILIAGGGPGGLQAAITCRERGHQVVLAEKSSALGGTMNFTDFDRDKLDLRQFKNLLIREVQSSGVDIRLNTTVSQELLEELHPDIILIAVGGHPAVPNIPGIEHAIGAQDIYGHLNQVGQTVVLVGGGLVGCEVGLYLAGEGRDVTVVELQSRMAPEISGFYRNALLNEMDARGIQQILSAKCLSFTPDGVHIEVDGEDRWIPADTAVYALGIQPNSDTVATIQSVAGDIPVRTFGDCAHVAKMGEAIRSGYLAGMEIM